MSETDAQNLPAGRATDALVARRVMGLPGGDAPAYSTDVAAAWQVVGALARRGITVDVQVKGAGRAYGHTTEVALTRGLLCVAVAFAETTPLAVCRAALALDGGPTLEPARVP